MKMELYQYATGVRVSLLSLGMFSRFPHVVAYVSTSFFMTEEYSLVWICIPLYGFPCMYVQIGLKTYFQYFWVST